MALEQITQFHCTKASRICSIWRLENKCESNAKANLWLLFAHLSGKVMHENRGEEEEKKTTLPHTRNDDDLANSKQHDTQNIYTEV